MPKMAIFGQKWSYSRSELTMKEAKKIIFLSIIELTDLKLVDIGTKIIEIGPVMPILEHFVTPCQVCIAL